MKKKQSSPRQPPPPPASADPRFLLDEAALQAAQTLVSAAQGGDVPREQLAAAQDILNRKGITSGAKTFTFPEAFAREAFGFVFQLLGFPPIKWPPSPTLETPEEVHAQTVDEFNAALRSEA